MNKLEIYKMLKDKNIEFEITEHKAVITMAELYEIENPHPDNDAKNLFVRDDKKQNYYLISVKGYKMVDLKAFRRKINGRHLSFASEDDLKNILGLIKGAVTPLGILNDKEKLVKVYIDKEFKNSLIGVHPNDNTATIWLNTNDLENIIKEHGNFIEYIEF